VGATPNPDKLGHAILANILAGGFTGRVYPVNPKEDRILGLQAYPTVSSIPGDLDLVVVVVPAALVAGILREAAGKGARAGIVISGGFRESGRLDLEDELKAVVRQTGLRIVGPNCQGINYRPNRLCASWPLVTANGPMAVISQSGTVAATLAGWAVDEGFGITATVSLGNQVDVCETDLVEYFAGDPATRTIALYLEGARDGRRFVRAVRQTLPHKPIVVLKSGVTAGGQRAAASHTRSLAGRDEVFDGVCRQVGLIRAPNLEALYDYAKGSAALAHGVGPRVAVITSSGGSGILAVDEAERCGLSVPVFSPQVTAALREAHLPPNAILANPLDLTVCLAQDFERAVDVLVGCEAADYYLLIFGDPIPGATGMVQRLRERIGSRAAVSYLGGGEVEKEERLRLHAAGIPVFPTPERAIGGIRAAYLAGRGNKL